MTFRQVRPALLALLVGTGCRALGVSDLASPTPLAAKPQPSIALDALIDRHNANARKLDSLQAETSVAFKGDEGGGGTHGRMAMERPRNFKMDLQAGFRSVADVGSNDDEFWVWSSKFPEKAIYVGHYDESGSLPAELALQPEWIVEALGVREITREERGRTTLAKGESAETQILVEQRINGKGGSTIKKTVVDRRTGQILEHRFYSSDGQLLAKAETSDYRAVRRPENDSQGAESTGAADTVLLPHKINLTATPPGQNPFHMDILLSSVQVNPTFSDTSRQALFTVPNKAGYKVVNINEEFESRPVSSATVRSTRPAPPTARARVQLGDPEPLGIDGASRTARDPEPLQPDLSWGDTQPQEPGGLDAVVGAQRPKPPGDDYELSPSLSASDGTLRPRRVR
jgi:hypothetical protein